jgi:signal peptidase II
MLNFLNTITFKSLRWLWVSFFVIALDQWSKQFVMQHLTLQEPVIVNKFFNLYLDYNIGAAFSFLKGANGWQVWLFAGCAVIISLCIFIYFLRNSRIPPLMGMGLALILGGAIGNLIDRVVHRYVIDFISWHAGRFYFPTFNIADSAVTIGAVLLLLSAQHKTEGKSS